MVRNWSQWAVALVAFAVFLGVAPAAAVAQRTGELYFAHGLPGSDIGAASGNSLPVDVSVGINGTGTLSTVFTSVRFGVFRGPLDLPLGVYQVVVTEANSQNPGSGTELASGTVAIAARSSFTFVFHLSDMGAAAGTAFENSADRIVSTKSRVVIRQVANQAPIDVSLTSLIGLPGTAGLGLTNATQTPPADLMSGPYLLSVTPAGLPLPNLVTPLNQTLFPLNSYYYYVVGSTENNTLQVLVQRVPLKRKLGF